MKPRSPHTLTWGTATTAIASALLLVGVGCIVPAAQRSADPGATARRDDNSRTTAGGATARSSLPNGAVTAGARRH